MRRVPIFLLLGCGLVLSAAEFSLPSSTPLYYSTDQYQRTRPLFESLSDHLDAVPDNSAPRSALDVLERSWSQGVYDARQVDRAISAVRSLADNPALSERDRRRFDGDWSRLLDFQREYYGALR